jgi:O-antigen ligase
MTGARWALIAVAMLMAPVAIFAGVASVPEPGRNPHSPEFGWLQWDWVVFLAIATLLLGAAIAVSSGRVRWALVGLLLVTWMSGIEPAIHLFRERIMPQYLRRNAGVQPDHLVWPNVIRASAG